MKKTYHRVIPSLYFLAILTWMFIENGDKSPSVILVLIALPFLVPIFRPHHLLDRVLGILTFFWSFWMLLAYLSDAMDIVVWDAESWNFAITGGLLIVANFVMSVWLIRNGDEKRLRLTDPQGTVSR